MGLRRRITIYVSAGILVGAIAWLAIYEPDESGPRILIDVEAEGTNAVPKLLELLERKDSKLRTKLLEWNESQSLVRLHLHSASDDCELASRGFERLGTNAAFVAPELIKIFLANESGDSRQSIAYIFTRLGQAGVETLYTSLANEGSTNVNLRTWELFVLENSETNYPRLMPVFAKALADTNAYVRTSAALDLILMNTNESSKMVVPALLTAATDTNSDVSRLAIRALKKIDTNAAMQAGFK